MQTKKIATQNLYKQGKIERNKLGAYARAIGVSPILVIAWVGDFL